MAVKFFKLESLQVDLTEVQQWFLKLEEFTEPKQSQLNSFGVFNLRYLMWSLSYFYYCR